MGFREALHRLNVGSYDATLEEVEQDMCEKLGQPYLNRLQKIDAEDRAREILAKKQKPGR